MSDNKTFASLSSSLLARKGGAKPAMRRPNYGGNHDLSHIDSDLGWNDMGEDHGDSHYSENPLKNAIPEVPQAVREQQQAIAAKLRATPEEELAADDIDAAAQNSEQDVSSDLHSDAVPLPEPVAPVEAPTEMKANGTVQSSVVKLPTEKRPAKKPPVNKASSVQSSRKTAFTLRLDAERHLRLRLATTIENVSAQRLVTKALDEYLKTIPDLDELAERLPKRQVG